MRAKTSLLLMVMFLFAGCNITGNDATEDKADALRDCLRDAGYKIEDTGVTHRGLDADDRDYNVVVATTPGKVELQAYAFDSADVARESYDEITFERRLQPEDPLVGPFVLDFEPPGAAAADMRVAVACAREAA